MAKDMQETVKSTCPYCGVGCGVLLTPDGQGGLTVKGDPNHPANFGRLCSKGTQLGQTIGLEGRLLAPEIGGKPASWEAALTLMAQKFGAAIRAHGPDSVAFYVSGQLLSEDYYVANKLMKGFIGSANIDTNSRLCMASSVAGHKRAFGADTVPGTYEDIDEADLVVLAGSNLAWAHPVLYQRLLAARKKRGTRIVVIDPRRTASCDGADLHLPIKAGADVALFNGLLAQIAMRGLVDTEFAEHVEGADEAFDAARDTDLAVTGLDPADIAAFYNLWCGTEKVVTIYSQGINQSSSGSDKVNAILNCHLATGRIGKPGLGPFSVTGQPNAMGGREVGGLANMLACHLELENADHRAAVGGFWGANALPESAGLKAVDMFDAVADGRIKALWIIHTNPAVTLPEADKVRDAIAGCDFVTVSDITAETDTARLADVLLPATAWGEKSGTVTNSDRIISRQRSVLPPPAGARPDWWALAELGRRMGWPEAFDYTSPADIFCEYAALSGLAGDLGRDFDISSLAGMNDAEFDQLPPTRWPVSVEKSGGRFFADGRFFTPSGKGRMLPVRYRPPKAVPDATHPFRLNTGRIRDQWHTMTRTAKSPRLSAHLPEPFLEIHPEDAAQFGVEPAALVVAENDCGRAILRARITGSGRRGDVFAPMHWTGENAPSARIDALVPAVTDPVSGQPESKAAIVALSVFPATWYGFAVSLAKPEPFGDYFALVRTAKGYRAEMAGQARIDDWPAKAREIFDLVGAEVQTYADPARGLHRFAFSKAGRLAAALFIAPTPPRLMRDHLATLPGEKAPGVLSGRAPSDMPDSGPLTCSCFNVGANAIIDAIETGDLHSVDAIGVALQAGTNCGSCRAEIAEILAATTHKMEPITIGAE